MGGGERYGTRIDEATAEFRCGVCGAPAGTVHAARAGEPVEMGPSFEARPMGSDGVQVIGFLGHAWTAMTAEGYDRVLAILREQSPDPVALRGIDPELAPFYCGACECSYCLDHWDTETVYDGDIYEHTRGTCPFGHLQLLDN